MAGSNMNGTLNGFRWIKDPGRKTPNTQFFDVATGYGIAIGKGDVLKLLNDGTVAVAAPGDTNLVGVADGAEYYETGRGAVRAGPFLPASLTWTVYDRRSRVRVILASRDTVFEAVADDKVTATTYAGYKAFLGENCDFAAGTMNATSGVSGQSIDISTHSAVDGNFRLLELPDAAFQDFSTDYVRLRVKFNESVLFTVAGI